MARKKSIARKIAAKAQELDWRFLVKNRRWFVLLVAFGISYFIRKFTPLGRILNSKRMPGPIKLAANKFLIEGAIIATLYLAERYNSIRRAQK